MPFVVLCKFYVFWGLSVKIVCFLEQRVSSICTLSTLKFLAYIYMKNCLKEIFESSLDIILHFTSRDESIPERTLLIKALRHGAVSTVPAEQEECGGFCEGSLQSFNSASWSKGHLVNL